jgi:Cdc6-like AAA superfamily ATPase
MKETERKDDAISVKSMQIPTLSTNSPYYTHDESCLLEFSIRRQNLNLNTHKISIDIITSDGDRKNILKEYLSKKKYTTISNQNEFIATSDSVYICLTSGFISNKTFIKIAGDYEEVEKIKEDFLNKYESTENQIYIDWKFLTEEGVRNLNCPLDLDHTPVQEMYPFLNCSLNEYYEKFIQSKSNILILKGPPGTGKTTFIKGLLHFAKTSASFVQDESLLNKDILFVDFFESSRKFLVCEDVKAINSFTDF